MSKPTAAPRAVEYLPLSQLRRDPANPKRHDLPNIQDSIGRFGVIDLMVRDDRTGYLISGHGRADSLAEKHARGEAAPDGIRVSESGEWLVPVVTGWASRSDTDAKAALVTLNRLTERGGWDDEALLGILEEMRAVDDGLLGSGFDLYDYEELLIRLGDNRSDPGAPPAAGEGDLPADRASDMRCPNCGHKFRA